MNTCLTNISQQFVCVHHSGYLELSGKEVGYMYNYWS